PRHRVAEANAGRRRPDQRDQMAISRRHGPHGPAGAGLRDRTFRAGTRAAVAWLVLVLSVGAILLLMLMMRDGAMNEVSSLFYLVPAVTALIAFVLFGEPLTPVQLAGTAVTTLGVWLATRRPRPPAP